MRNHKDGSGLAMICGLFVMVVLCSLFPNALLDLALSFAAQ